MIGTENRDVVIYGSLREDLYFEYDFSIPMATYEQKTPTYKSVIGGSVFNTGCYLGECTDDINVCLYTWKHIHLLNRVGEKKMKVIPFGRDLHQHPVSVIGIANNGEKRMLSSDGEEKEDKSLQELFQIQKALLFYTSFYEVNDSNCTMICKLLDFYRDLEVHIFVDLCPIIGEIPLDIVSQILSRVDTLSGNNIEYEKVMTLMEVSNVEMLIQLYPNIKNLIIKEGEKGAKWIALREHKVCVYEEHIEEPVFAINTTGCGDVFNATVIEGLCNKKSIEEILKKSVENGTEIAKGGLEWTRVF